MHEDLIIVEDTTVQLNAASNPRGLNFYSRVQVRVQAHTHATSYLLRVISTNDKNTSLLSPILRVSLLVYVYAHIVKSQSGTFLLCMLVVVSIILTG